MFLRVNVTGLVTQEFGERQCFNAWTSNGLCNGDTWGALLPTYDGGDFLDRKPRDSERPLWASSVDRVRNQMAIEGLPARSSLRTTHAPGVWQEPVVYEIEAPAVAPAEGGLLRALNPSALGPSALNPS